MKPLVALAVLTFTLLGCQEEKLVVTDPSTNNEQVNLFKADAAKVDVGDAEATVDIELTLDPASAQNVTSEELRNQKKKLNSLTLTVAPPKPSELWIGILVKTNQRFDTRPVALRGKVFREVPDGEKEEIFTFATILDANSTAIARREPGDYYPMEFRVNAMEGLSDLPASMLVHATVDAAMAPVGTDPATMDPNTYTAGEEDSGVLLSNPVRINYNPTAALDNVLENPLGTPGTPEAALAPDAEATEEAAPAPDAAATTEAAPAADAEPAPASTP